MAERILTSRELNRATLARQLLLERATLPAVAAIERLVGLQAQTVNAPYIGLWTRLWDFRRADLTDPLTARAVVRATLMRATLHLFTAADYIALRADLQPALSRALQAFFGRRAQGLDHARLVAAAQAAVAESPRTFSELRAILSAIEPDRDAEALAYVVRTHLPLVQAPPAGTWGQGGSPTHVTADAWLGRPIAEPAGPRALILRYLAAFGPASVQDVQTWSGLVGLNQAIAALKPELRTFRDERGRELFDLPDAPAPNADTPAPPRFLPEYDNLLLSHADRTRVVADEHRPRIFLSAGRVRSTFLIDGVVHGAWRIERGAKAATLVIEPFAPLPAAARAALLEEGERLVRFVEDGSASCVVRVEA